MVLVGGRLKRRSCRVENGYISASPHRARAHATTDYVHISVWGRAGGQSRQSIWVDLGLQHPASTVEAATPGLLRASGR